MRAKLFAARAWETRDWSCLPRSWRRQWMVQRIIATPDWADFQKIACVYDRAAYLTYFTGTLHEVDHEIPLNHPMVCGLHNQFNVRAHPKRQNAAKSNHWHRDQLALPIPERAHAHQMALTL